VELVETPTGSLRVRFDKLSERSQLFDEGYSFCGLLLQRGGDGGGARELGGQLLGVIADDVVEEGANQFGLSRVLVLRAPDQVADQDNRVHAGLGRCAVDLDRQVARATAF